MCGALAYVIYSVYQLGAEAQTERAVELARGACSQLQTEYDRATSPARGRPDGALMGALLNVVLDDAPGVEGGFFHNSLGFVAYAYPTHQGSQPKTDVPSTERGRIETLVRSSLGGAGAAPAMTLQRGTREAIVVVACPVETNPASLGAWTMARVPVAAGEAYDEVTRGLALLLFFAVGSGVWLSHSYYRWTSLFGRIEGALGTAGSEGLPPIAPTGDGELDRIVAALNGFRQRLEATQVQAAELRSSLERQERYAALGRMAATVAHEVRNPIAAIRLRAENALVQPERRESALALVLREVERVDGIVKTLLSRAEPVQVHLREVNIRDWFSTRIASFSDRSTAKQIDVRSIPVTGSWRLDPDALGRALNNLIDNALDHTPSGGSIEVRARTNGDPVSLLVTVSDTGPGVSPAVRDRLFEPFVSSRADGLGLGLAIAREVAQAHGGSLRHVPRPSGACFELQIPWHAS